MKPRRALSISFAGLAIWASFSSNAGAANADYYWDTNGATAGTGGTGAWDTTTANWSTASAGNIPTVVYPNASGSTTTAHLTGTTGTVTIAASTTISINTLANDTAGFTIAGTNSTSVLNFTGTTPTLSGPQAGTVSAKITGSAGLTVPSGSYQILASDLSGLSGTVNVNGRINMVGTGTPSVSGGQFQTWNIGSGATLSSHYQGTNSTIQLGALSGSGTLRIGNTGSPALGGIDTYQIGALNTSTTFSGNIVDFTSGALGRTAITKVGSGTLTLSGTGSNYTGGTTINAGAIDVRNDTAMGPATSAVTINDGGSLLNNDSVNHTLGYPMTLSGTTNGVTFGGTKNLTLTGAFTWTTGLKATKTGASVLTLSFDNTGAALVNGVWTVQGGTYNSSTGIYDSVIALNSGRALGNVTGNVLNLNAGTLQFTADGGTGYASARSINVTANGGSISDGGFAFGEATAGQGAVAPALSIATGSGLNLVSTKKLQLSSVITGSGGIKTFATGVGSVILIGASNYSGGTTINAGTLDVRNDTALGTGTVTINDGTTLANNDANAHTLANAVTLVGATNGATFTGSKNLTLTGAISSAAAIKATKTGASVLTISTDNSGTLQANSNWNVTGGTYNSSTGLYDNVIAINRGQALGNSIGNVLNLNGGTLRFTVNGDAGYNSNRTINVQAGGGSIDDGGFAPGEAGGGGSVAPSIPIASGATLSLVASNKLVLGGTISGTGGAVSKFGPGTATLNGSNTYSGGTSVIGGTLIVGNANALGSSAAPLSVTNSTLNLNGNNVTAGNLTISNASIIGLNPAGGGLVATTATSSGTNYIGLNGGVSSAGTFNLISSAGGGLGGTFLFGGAADLTVPVTSLITKVGADFYRMSLNNTGSAVQLQLTNNNASGTPITITSLGASISSGTSSTGVPKAGGAAITSYNGGGYRTQWYQNLVNDGRFNPSFTGSDTNLQANNPSGVNILTTAGQTQAEGHPGYRTNQTLWNLNHNGGDGGNNGGFWLQTGNGRNPDYIALNVGGNDMAANATDAQAVRRYDAILSELNTLRPGVTTMMSTMAYRTDSGAAINTYFNPFVQGNVYNHTLAGENVRFVDLYTLFSPGDSQAILSSDGIHPTQVGYNQIANAWYHATIYGAAFFTGDQGTTWNAISGTDSNWAMDPARSIDRNKTLNDAGTNTYVYPDVFFNNNSSPLATTLGADTTIRGLNFSAGATGSVSVGGANTLTLGGGGITVQQGTGAHSLSANVVLSADQTWGNVSSNNFTVSGNISGSKTLTIAGAYSVYKLSPTATSGNDIVSTTTTGTGIIELTGTNTYSGRTNVASGTLLVSAGSISGGTVGQTIIVNDTGANTATMTQTGGSVSAGTGEIWIGQNSGSTGTYNLTAGTLTSANWFAIGRNVATGTLNITGGTLNHSGNNMTIGAGGGLAGNGTVNQTGGAYNDTKEIWLGEVGTANYNMSGGTVSATGGLRLSRGANPATLTLQNNTGTTGGLANGGGNETFTTTTVAMSENTGASTVNLDGGTLVANQIQSAGGLGSKTFNFNGGTLKAGASNAAFITGISNVFVKSGNAVIDTNGQTITLGQALLTDTVSTGGGLVKNGAGTLTSNTNNTYTGATSVNTGTLETNNLQANGTASGIGSGTAMTLNGGTLRYTGAANGNGFNRVITVGASGGTLDNFGGQFIFDDGSFAGSGALSFIDTSLNRHEWLITGDSPTFSGNVSVGNGTAASGLVQYRSNNANPLGTGTITVNAGGTLTADSGVTSPTTLGNAIVLNGGLLGTQNPAMTYAGPISLAATSTVGAVPGYDTAAITLSNVISGNSGATLTIATTASVTLSGTNTYTGATQVTTGTLLVNGSLDAASDVSISAATTLGGAGTVNGSVTTAGTTSIIAPGNNGIGTLHIGNGALHTGTTTLTGVLATELNATTGDTLDVMGNLDVTGATVTFTKLVDPTAPKYVIAKYTGTLTGTLASTTIPLGYELKVDATAKEIQLVKPGFAGFMDGFNGLSASDKLPGADPDQDGISNLVEYSLAGFDPTVANGAPGTLASGTLSFTKRDAAVANGDLTYAIEESSTLGAEPHPWVEVSPTVNDATTISYALPTGQNAEFARLKIHQN